MKKILLTSFAVTAMLMTTSTRSDGQLVNNNVQLSGLFTVFKKDQSANSPGADRVNPAVIRNFIRTYKGVTNEKWIEIQNGFVAMFSLNDIDYQVTYDKKGTLVRAIRSYQEAKLAPNLRHIIKSNYYDYDINLVQEIENSIDPVTYVIHLTGKTELIDLGFTDGELQVLQKFKRSE
jgi:hypothetical protein